MIVTAKKPHIKKKHTSQEGGIEIKKLHPYYLEMKEKSFPPINFPAMKQRILDRRKELKLTQATIGSIIGMGQQNVFKAERLFNNHAGQKYNFFTLEQVYNLKHALGVSYDYIFEGKDFERKQWDFQESPLKLDCVAQKKRIINRRMTLGLFQIHVADLIGMSSVNYSNAEKTVPLKSNFTIEQIYNLKHVLGISYDYIFEGVEEIKETSQSSAKENKELKAENAILKERLGQLQEFSQNLMQLNKMLTEKLKSG